MKLDAEEAKAHLDTLPMAIALWWFIENINEDDPTRSELFFYLRERIRDHDPKADYKYAKKWLEAQS